MGFVEPNPTVSRRLCLCGFYSITKADQVHKGDFCVGDAVIILKNPKKNHGRNIETKEDALTLTDRDGNNHRKFFVKEMKPEPRRQRWLCLLIPIGVEFYDFMLYRWSDYLEECEIAELERAQRGNAPKKHIVGSADAAKGDTDKTSDARRASANGSPQGKLIDID